LEFSPSRWNQGFVLQDKHALLLASLEKTGLQEAYQYEYRFSAPDLFQWGSQNRHTQEGSAGKLLKNHQQEGVQVHLFVRATRKNPRGRAASFSYCGDVEFVEWEGSEPI